MRDYNESEPLEVGAARNKFDDPLTKMAYEYRANTSIIRGQLFYREDTPAHVREAKEDLLLYQFCEATHAYCAIKSDLDQAKDIPAITKHWMDLAVEQLREQAISTLDLMIDVDQSYKPDGSWYAEFIEFGKWFYKDDKSISLQDMMYRAMQGIGQSIDAFNDFDRKDREGKDPPKRELTGICQQLGLNKTMIESCLLPAVILKGDIMNANILEATKKGVVDKFIVQNKLSSHLTTKGFMFERSGLGKDEKNYFAKAFEKVKTLTNSKRAKLIQEESLLGSRIEGEFAAGKGSLKAIFDMSYGVKSQHDPEANKFIQFIQKSMTTLGSTASMASSSLKTIGDMIESGVAGGILKNIYKNISIQYDPNKIVEGDEIKKKPSTYTSLIQSESKDEQSTDIAQAESTNVNSNAQSFKEATKEQAELLVELSKLYLKSNNVEVNDISMDDILAITDKLESVGAVAINFNKEGFDRMQLIGTFAELSDLLYEYQDFSKLPKVDVEVNKLASQEREHIKTVIATVAKCWQQEYDIEQRWLSSEDGEFYKRSMSRVRNCLESAGYQWNGDEHHFTPSTAVLVEDRGENHTHTDHNLSIDDARER